MEMFESVRFQVLSSTFVRQGVEHLHLANSETVLAKVVARIPDAGRQWCGAALGAYDVLYESPY